MIGKSSVAILISAVAFLLQACGGSSGGVGDPPATGTVAVVLTDGPTDIYDRIEVSMTGMSLIGPGGQVALYEGPEVTFDLLAMSEWGDLAFSTEVLAGSYNKIRIQLSKLELIDLPSGARETIDKLPANGKIDLNPRGQFEVSPDATTVVKLDMDARRSFQAVRTGAGKIKFRPIIFVDVYQDALFLPDRLVRVFGAVEEASITGVDTPDPDDDSFRLCGLRFVSQSAGPSTAEPDDCIRVYADARTGVFDGSGAEAEFSGIPGNRLLTAIGFITDTDDTEAFLGLNSVVLELGEREDDATDGWETVQGIVTSGQTACGTDDRCFDFDRADDDSEDPADPVIPPVRTRMQPSTRVFHSDGMELAQSEVSLGDTGSVDALFDEVEGELLAALVVLDTDSTDSIVAGVLVMKDLTATPYKILNMTADTGEPVDICIDDNTVLLQILVEDDVVTIADLLDLEAVEAGARIEAYGDPGSVPVGCGLLADQVFVEQ